MRMQSGYQPGESAQGAGPTGEGIIHPAPGPMTHTWIEDSSTTLEKTILSSAHDVVCEVPMTIFTRISNRHMSRLNQK